MKGGKRMETKGWKKKSKQKREIKVQRKKGNKKDKKEKSIYIQKKEMKGE